MEVKTVYFEDSKEDYTEEVLGIVSQRAKELGIKSIVVASNTGDTAVKALKTLKDFHVIIVSLCTGWPEPNVQRFTEENRKLVESQGVKIITATLPLEGVCRAMRTKFNTHSIGDIISNTLRVIGQGVKVGCEMAMMATDAGLVRTDEDIITIAGTSGATNTAMVISPVNSHDFFDIKVREILCKPRL